MILVSLQVNFNKHCVIRILCSYVLILFGRVRYDLQTSLIMHDNIWRITTKLIEIDYILPKSAKEINEMWNHINACLLNPISQEKRVEKHKH